jgi:hypothetical protein
MFIKVSSKVSSLTEIFGKLSQELFRIFTELKNISPFGKMGVPSLNTTAKL